MRAFAALLDGLIFAPARHAKLALLDRYFRSAPDPDRGYALGALTGALNFAAIKPAQLKALIAARTDPQLFAWSYDYVGDLAETIALTWPAPSQSEIPPPPALAEVVAVLAAAKRAEAPALVAGWLDRLDAGGRWALLKLIAGGLRVGVSGRLAKMAVAGLSGGTVSADAIEELWHGLSPPYADLFAWVEGRAARPVPAAGPAFRPPMLAHPLDEAELATLDPADFLAEWKWDGVRVQLVAEARLGPGGGMRLYSRAGEDLSPAFPDLLGAVDFAGVLDGELLVAAPGPMGEGRIEPQPFAALQPRLGRKSPTAALMRESPAVLRAYDLLAADGEDLRPQTLSTRRVRLEAFLAGLSKLARSRIDLSPLIPFATWAELGQYRADSAMSEARVVEGVMLKRKDAPYLPGRPMGLWYKWKRGPLLFDCVLMYAQRGHGKRSSFYSDFTFGCWQDGVLLPVGKAYFGFTDAELKDLDRWVRDHTLQRFGPVREVEKALVLEIACDGLQPSNRHKSGIAMRFPRIHRVRWDKPASEADGLDALRMRLPNP